MYAIINDYENCEIFIRELPADTDVRLHGDAGLLQVGEGRLA